ncbi:MAG: HlyD family efflux transporter periplasmic adaptor subunit [Deltaproteobacteria bacterium]|nr:HlyD family efflux transporter periplasmic adaptor subunit [Deltaproteobacteria bacterium]
MKRWLIGVFLGIGVAALIFYFYLRNQNVEPPHIKISGNIETTEVDLGFKISGRIVQISVREGDWIEKGKVIARLDDEDLRQRFELAQATLRSSHVRLEKLLAGSRPEEVKEAEANLQATQFDFENKKIQYERMKTLFDGRVIPRETLDNAETRFKVAKAALEGATEVYKKVKEGPRKEDIEDGKFQVEQARASLRLAETQLGYAVLQSPISGIVLVKSGEVGEVVNPGTSILTLADIVNVWLKAYIPETELSRVRWGQEVIVKTDLHPQKEYRGKITFISSQSEFTPKQIQTEKERVTLVYRIKVDIPNPNHELKPGMPADGRILLGPSPDKK